MQNTRKGPFGRVGQGALLRGSGESATAEAQRSGAGPRDPGHDVEGQDWTERLSRLHQETAAWVTPIGITGAQGERRNESGRPIDIFMLSHVHVHSRQALRRAEGVGAFRG